MPLIEFVKIDHLTGLPATEAPTRHGPADPIQGIEHLWFTRGAPPHYFGRVPDGADINAPGILQVLDTDAEAAMIANRQATLTQHVASIRFTTETGGISLPGGTQINTQRDAQAMLTGAYQSLKSGLVQDTEWKATSGWVTVTLTELEPIAQAVAEHVRRCFQAERAVSDQITSATTVDQLQALDLQTAFDTAYSA